MPEGYTEVRCPLPPIEYLEKERENFQKIVKSFAARMNISLDNIQTDASIIDEISKRVHQRRNYYLFFHGKNLIQSRQAAIKAYWILKYRPIRLFPQTTWNKAFNINVYFAFFILFVQAIGEYFVNCPKEIQGIVANRILNEYEDEYIRAFSEYDISKEAMMLISDSLKSIVKCEIRNCS